MAEGYLPIAHPPTPTGATKHELQVIANLHRKATITTDEASAPIMLDGVALIVELIGDRDRPRHFAEDDAYGQGDAPEGWEA